MRDVKRKVLIFLILSILITPLTSATSIDIIQKGLSGALSSDITYEDTSNNNSNIYIGTQLGIYLFSENGSLINFIQTGSSVINIVSISDINSNGYDEIIFTTTNTYFPNILCYDTLTGEKIWDFSSETDVFDMDMLWTKKQVSAYGLAVSSSKDKIYLTAGYNVICLNTDDGTKQSVYEGTDNMWDITLVDDDVIVGDQNGYIYRLESETLNPIWKTLISQPYTIINPQTKEEMGTVTRSVWDISELLIDEEKFIIASCEDGNIYKIDFENGNIIKSSTIIEYVNTYLYAYYGDYPLPTSIYGYNFFNMKLRTIPDVTGDDNKDLLIYTYPGNRGGKQYQGARKGIYILDSIDLTIKSKNENFDLSKITNLEIITRSNLDNKTYIIMPIGKSGSNEKIKLVSAETCETYKTISINVTSGSARTNSYITKAINENEFLLCSNYGDIIRCNLNGNITWVYPRITNIEIEQADLVGSSTADLFIKSSEATNDDSFLQKTNSRIIYALDGETREINWSYEMDYDEYLLTNGLQQVKIIDDVNNDGKNDIVAYKQHDADWGRGDEYGENTSLIVFLNNGTILYEKPLTESTYYGVWETISKQTGLEQEILENLEYRKIRKTIESLDIINDVSGDGISDFIIGSWKEVYILNSTNGEIIWTKTYDPWVYQDPDGINPMSNQHWDWLESDRMQYYALDDHNNDGYNELLQISWDEMNILRSTTTSGLLDYEPYKEIKYESGNIDTSQIKIFDDLNADNFKDIMFQMHIQDSPSIYKCISGLDGTNIIQFEREGTTIDLAVSDFNGDEIKDSIVFHKYGSTGPRLEVISGKNSEAIWIFTEYEEAWEITNQYGINDIMPACSINDFNNDGINDLAIGKSLPWDEGAQVLIYDIKNSELLKTITIESISQDVQLGDQRWQPAIIISSLSDLNNDNIDEIGVLMLLGEGGQKQLKLVVLDIKNSDMICDFVAKGTNIFDVEGKIATYGSGGELYFLNPDKDLSISDPLENQQVTAPVKITWDEQNTETVKVIMVDNNRITKTFDEYAEFDLKSGTRKITIYSFDEYGKGLYESITIEVKKTSAIEIPLTIIALVLISFLFIPKFYPLIIKKSIKRREQVNE
jgi:hypothetical protein